MKKLLAISMCLTSIMQAMEFPTITTMEAFDSSLHSYFNGYHPGTIIVLDIDNTIGTLYGDLRLDPLIFNLNLALLRKFCPEAKRMDPFEATFGDLISMYNDATMQPLDRHNTIQQTIANLQANGIPVIFLTSRSSPLQAATDMHIRSNLGITPTDLARGVEIHFPEISVQVLFNKGVLYCGSNSKGLVLSKFFEKLDLHFNNIIFADDDTRNLQAVCRDFSDKNATICPYLIKVSSDIKPIPHELEESIRSVLDNVDTLDSLINIPPYLLYPSMLSLLNDGLKRGSLANLTIDIPDKNDSPTPSSPFAHMPLSCPAIPSEAFNLFFEKALAQSPTHHHLQQLH